MGVIDPTTGLMAGMFIDRMRSAQAQEQAPNQTVAQRVLGPQAPPAPPAGLGATPQGMQMAGGPGPQMAAPPQMIPPAPQGPVRMAVGGLTTLPIPDDMYDERTFAGGGIVAFAKGDSVDAELIELMNEVRKGGPRALVAQQRIRELQQKGTGIASELSSFSPQRLADLGVSRGEGGIHDNLLSHIRPLSLEGGASDEQMRPGRVTPGAGTRTPGENAQALKDYMTNAASLFGGNVGGASGAQYTPIVDNQRAAGINALMASSVAPTPVRTPAPLGDRGVVGAPRAPAGSSTATGGVPDYLKGLQATAVPGLGATQKEMLDLIGGVPAPKGTSDEAKAARKNEDLFSTLAQIGFGMAAGESPNALTNIGKAAAAAVPGMQEAIKERRKDTKEELQQQYAYELAKHGLSKDALVAAVGRTDTLTKNELAKVTALAEIKSKQIEGDKDRDVLRSGQANTSKYYDYFMGKDDAKVERIAGILSKGEGISIEQARVKAVNMLNPGYTRGNKLTPYQAEQSARADYKIAFPMDPPPGGAEAWIRNKTAEKLAGGGDGETPNPANRIRLNAQGLPE
jgi:hypothetical protein